MVADPKANLEHRNKVGRAQTGTRVRTSDSAAVCQGGMLCKRKEACPENSCLHRCTAACAWHMARTLPWLAPHCLAHPLCAGRSTADSPGLFSAGMDLQCKSPRGSVGEPTLLSSPFPFRLAPGPGLSSLASPTQAVQALQPHSFTHRPLFRAVLAEPRVPQNPPSPQVPLEKGYSQVDWMRVSRATPAPKLRKDITMEEVAQHKTRDDAWMVFRNRVGILLLCHAFRSGMQCKESWQGTCKLCACSMPFLPKTHPHKQGQHPQSQSPAGVPHQSLPQVPPRGGRDPHEGEAFLGTCGRLGEASESCPYP